MSKNENTTKEKPCPYCAELVVLQCVKGCSHYAQTHYSARMAVIVGFRCDVIGCDLARQSVQRGESACEYPGNSSRLMEVGVTSAAGLTSILHRWQHLLVKR